MSSLAMFLYYGIATAIIPVKISRNSCTICVCIYYDDVHLSVPL